MAYDGHGNSEAVDGSVSNTRVQRIRPLIPPSALLREQPLTSAGVATVESARRTVVDIMRGEDDRLLVVVGPCSVHDPEATIEYAERLHEAATALEEDVFVVMRAYFEKPRTGRGWKGLINDPFIDETFDIDKGLRMARRLLVGLAGRGLPAACEFLDPVVPQYLGDLVSLATIGARTAASQVHRELASGLSAPVGFKNSVDGNVTVAVDAVRASAHPHHFLGVTEHGVAAIVGTRGNDDCFLVLRGGHAGPNYDSDSVERAKQVLTAAGLPAFLMVDCSHGNSNGDHRRQPRVVGEVLEQLAAGDSGISGVMMESFLVEGKQPIVKGRPLMYGQSITDACMSWDVTRRLLYECARGVGRRRARWSVRPPREVAARASEPASS